MPVRERPWPPGAPCWVDALVADPAAARDFYARLFGWEVYDGGDDGAGYLTAYKNDKAVAGIGPRPADLGRSRWTTHLATDDVDALAERVVAAGGALTMAPRDIGDAGRILVGVDPTGATFGAWQAGRLLGTAVYAEHGAPRWHELRTRDLARAMEFYAAAFGQRHVEGGDGIVQRFATATVPGAEGPVCGLTDVTLAGGDRASAWLTWFQVDDLDAAVTLAVDLGAQVLSSPASSDVGTMLVVEAPQGEVLGLVAALGG